MGPYKSEEEIGSTEVMAQSQGQRTTKLMENTLKIMDFSIKNGERQAQHLPLLSFFSMCLTSATFLKQVCAMCVFFCFLCW
jgi:hypothetical protein